MLAPGGTLLVTFPLGYNLTIDAALVAGALRFDHVGFLQRISRDNRWRETTASACRDARYDTPYPQGNVIAVGIRDGHS